MAMQRIFILSTVFASALSLCAIRGAGGADVLSISADLREAPRGLLHATITIPVSPGPLTLLYAKWIPGDHAPSGPVIDLAGLRLSAGGAVLPWRRDPENMYAVHVDVPGGVSCIQANVEYLGPIDSHEAYFSDAIGSPQLCLLRWNQLALYPSGSDANAIVVKPSVVLPGGWKLGSSLEIESTSGATTTFKPVTLEMLIDQPVIAGAHYRRIELGKKIPGTPQHFMDIAADSEEALGTAPVKEDAEGGLAGRDAALQRIPGEYAAVMGARFYRTYHFLVSLSERMGGSGTEHHQCSDDRGSERSLIDADEYLDFGSLITHEYFHSWNGKHKRPAGLLSPDYQRPMHTDLLWVYEGLTEYYGDVMAVRCGLWSPEQYREYIALVAAKLLNHKGRGWRPLQDTADAAPMLYYGPHAWANMRRGTDFYDEGELLWLEVDAFIRAKSKGERSLDDFCRLFLGDGAAGAIDPDKVQGRDPSVVTYEAQDVFEALDKVEPNDWQGFFAQRLKSTDVQPAFAGLSNSGWTLEFNSEPNKAEEASEKSSHSVRLDFSLGFTMDGEKQEITDIVPGGPADLAGLAPGMKIIGVNGRKYSEESLKSALSPSRESKPVMLLVENSDFLTNLKVEYDGSERSPHLKRRDDAPDLLANILKPRTWDRAPEPAHADR